MNFAEIFVFFLLMAMIYFLLSPLRKRLEKRFYKYFRSKSDGSGPIIDVTDYSHKKEK